jgi:hypothetical protein
MAKRKLSKKQLAALARGRAKARGRRKSSSPVRRKTVKVQKVAKRKARRTTRRTTKKRGMFANVSGMLGAVAYGLVREKASTAIAQSRIGQQLPATEFTDEAVMLAINFGARKIGLGKNPIGNSILKAQKTVELARIGQTLNDVMAKRTVAGNAQAKGQIVVLS